MGGFGSGRRERTSEKTLTSDKLSIECRQRRRWGRLVAGRTFNHHFPKAGGGSKRIVVKVNPEVLDIRPDEWSEAKDVTWTVSLERTSVSYGQRTWFRCPSLDCNRRVAILYINGPDLACRRCSGLMYWSQYLRKEERLLLNAQRIRVKLGGEPNFVDHFLPKPKGMRLSRYHKLLRAANRAEELHFEHLRSTSIARLLAKIPRP